MRMEMWKRGISVALVCLGGRKVKVHFPRRKVHSLYMAGLSGER